MIDSSEPRGRGPAPRLPSADKQHLDWKKFEDAHAGPNCLKIRSYSNISRTSYAYSSTLTCRLKSRRSSEFWEILTIFRTHMLQTKHYMHFQSKIWQIWRRSTLHFGRFFIYIYVNQLNSAPPHDIRTGYAHDRTARWRRRWSCHSALTPSVPYIRTRQAWVRIQIAQTHLTTTIKVKS